MMRFWLSISTGTTPSALKIQSVVMPGLLAKCNDQMSRALLSALTKVASAYLRVAPCSVSVVANSR
jgi:hypothetical protein